MDENLVSVQAEEVEEVERVNLEDCEYTFRHYRVDPLGELVHYQRGVTKWSVHPRGGFTECFLQRKGSNELDSNELVGYGFALCSNQDPYCYRTGRQIARGRARKTARVGFDPYIWGVYDSVAYGMTAEYAPFLTVEEARDYLESRLPDRFPFLEG